MTDPNLVPPPQYSEYAALPEAVRETLYRSYIDRVNSPGKYPGAGRTEVPQSYRSESEFPNEIAGALADAWYQFGRDLSKHPSTFWDALKCIPPASLNIIVIIYERMAALDPALWRSIRWIRNIWVVSSAGFKCEYLHREAMAQQYSSIAGTICKDTKGTFQDGSGKKELLAGGQEHPGCDTWREIPRGGSQWGLHFLVGNRALKARSESAQTLGELDLANRSLDEVHLDWTDPVKAGAQDGYCNYDYFKSAVHLVQVKSGSGIPRCPFYAPEDISEIKKRIGKLKTKDPAAAAKYEAQCNNLDLKLKALNPVALACKGYQGWVEMENGGARDIKKLLAEVQDQL